MKKSAAINFIHRRFESIKAGEQIDLYNEDFHDGLNDDQVINYHFYSII